MALIHRIAVLSLLCTSTTINNVNVSAFTPTFLSQKPTTVPTRFTSFKPSRKHAALHLAIDNYDDDGDEEDDDEDLSAYEQNAASEFLSNPSSSSITPSFSQPVDWGGEYDTLRSRLTDTESGNIGPSRALFRTMTAETPNEAIMNFVSGASPEVVTAMSAAVTSLLGGLMSPSGGVQTIVKANGEKLGSLCFQLQMTGYMFRNAEYVLAIRDLMNIQGSATLEDYKRAFDKIDEDGSGYIESKEIEALLLDVYGEDELPAFEVETFLQFFDSNNDGRISWEEFEKGLGVVADKTAAAKRKKDDGRSSLKALTGTAEEEDDDWDDEEEATLEEPTISGMVEIEMKNGKVIKVEAKEYIKELKKEAEALKAALSRERDDGQSQFPMQPQSTMSAAMDPSKGGNGGIASYIASLEGDIKSLTEGISPEVVKAMKMLVEFVLDGGPSGQGKSRKTDKQLEMEIPGSALQQLALWQLVLGYKLREAEANGEYRQMLE